MGRALFTGLAMCLAAGTAGAQVQQSADSRTVLGGGDEYLSAAADAIRAGEYADGIRLTTLGLERPQTDSDRAAALSNLCAAHAAKGEPDAAIKYCDESITINEHNWRAYINRSYAYLPETDVRRVERGPRRGRDAQSDARARSRRSAA